MATNNGKNTLTNAAVKDLKEIRRRVLTKSQPLGETTGAAHPPSNVWYWGRLASPLFAPVCDGFLFPTYGLVDVYFPDTNSIADPKPLLITNQSQLLGLQVTNRDVDQTGKIGWPCKIEFAFGEWSFKWVGRIGDCDSQSSSSSSSASQSQSGSSSVSGSGSSSGSCGSVTVVTGVSCSSGGLNVTYGSAKANC